MTLAEQNASLLLVTELATAFESLTTRILKYSTATSDSSRKRHEQTLDSNRKKDLS